MTRVAGITATALVALGWRLDWRDDGALYITLTNLARIDHSSAASRVIGLPASTGMHTDHRESPCRECMLSRQQSEVTSFTGQMDEVVLPSHCPGAPAFTGHGGTVQNPKPSAAPVSILQLKYNSKGPGPCQINENDPGARPGGGGEGH